MSNVLHSPGSALNNIAYSFNKRLPFTLVLDFSRVGGTDATPYVAGDAIHPPVAQGGTARKGLRLKGGIEAGINPLLLTALLVDFAQQATPLDADLLLFDSELEKAPVDNDRFNPTPMDMSRFLGTVRFDPAIAQNIGTGYRIYEPTPNKIIRPPQGDVLFGVLVARAAYTPVAGEKFTVTLGFLPQDLSIYG
jgi:hypothetical protein